jgi:hypothetical protein
MDELSNPPQAEEISHLEETIQGVRQIQGPSNLAVAVAWKKVGDTGGALIGPLRDYAAAQTPATEAKLTQVTGQFMSAMGDFTTALGSIPGVQLPADEG